MTNRKLFRTTFLTKFLAISLLFTIHFSLFTIHCIAQPPAIKYQAVARNAEGEPVAEQQISIKLSLHSTSPTGTVVYAELHQPTTNQYGLVNLEIGRGEVQTGVFVEIDWLATDYFLQTELDITGGENFTDMGTTQLLSVPYALSAGSAKTAQHSQTATLAETASVAKGVFLKDADGTPFKLTIGENGQLTTECAIKAIDADGNEYKTVKIGNQIWMAENLNVGVMILAPTKSNPTMGTIPTDNNVIEKYCFDNVPENCKKHGGLYKWDEAMQYTIVEGSQGICPSGWHIPTKDEFDQLLEDLAVPLNFKTFELTYKGDHFNYYFSELNGLPFLYPFVSFWTSTQSWKNDAYQIGFYEGEIIEESTDKDGDYDHTEWYSISIRCIKNK